MSDQLKEIADIPRDFFRDGTQFMNRCTKRKASPLHNSGLRSTSGADKWSYLSGQARILENQSSGGRWFSGYGCHRIRGEAEYVH